MLNHAAFEQWCRQLHLSRATAAQIAAVRTLPPSCRVQGRAHNVSGTYASQKMGVTIQFESHTIELWAIYLMEYDPAVVEYFDQLPPLKIRYLSISGRQAAPFGGAAQAAP